MPALVYTTVKTPPTAASGIISLDVQDASQLPVVPFLAEVFPQLRGLDSPVSQGRQTIDIRVTDVTGKTLTATIITSTTVKIGASWVLRAPGSGGALNISATNPTLLTPDYTFGVEGVSGYSASVAFVQGILGAGATNSVILKANLDVLLASGAGLTAAQAFHGFVRTFNPNTEASGSMGLIDFEATVPYGNAGYFITRGRYTQSFPVTCTSANPGVFTKIAHGLKPGDRIRFQTTGALPTNVAVGTWASGETPSTGSVYFVAVHGLTADTFEITTELNGDLGGGTGSVNTAAGLQSGAHTATATATDDWGGGSSGVRINQESLFRPAQALLISAAPQYAMGYTNGIFMSGFKKGGFVALADWVYKADDAIPFVSGQYPNVAGADSQVAMFNSRNFGDNGDSLEFGIGNGAVYSPAPGLDITAGIAWQKYIRNTADLYSWGLHLQSTVALANGRTNKVLEVFGNGIVNFNAPAGADSSVRLSAPAGLQALTVYSKAGVPQWSAGKDGSDGYLIFDNINSLTPFKINSSGHMTVQSAGKNLGFYAKTPVALQTGVPVTAAGIHAALVNLGLFTA